MSSLLGRREDRWKKRALSFVLKKIGGISAKKAPAERGET